jgi:sn-glycerol 3-phosphate transport system permease protein
LSAPDRPAAQTGPAGTALQPAAGGTLALPSTGVTTETSRLTLGRERPRVPWATLLIHAALVVCVAIIAFPLYYAFVISTQEVSEVVQKPPRLLPSTHLVENYTEAWRRSGMARMLVNSTIVAVGVAVGKIAISMLSAFAIVYFRFRGASLVFWLIFLTLMLPIPVRILPTYEVIGNIGWLDSYAGLTVPLMASATATFLFRQFYLTIPNELAEAAQIDGAGALRFLWSFLLPLSWANIAALFVVLFIYGWNEYFWPLLITNTEEMRTVVIGLERLIPRSGTELPTWNLIMAGAMMALLPPVAVIIFMQRWFVKGLVESEK